MKNIETIAEELYAKISRFSDVVMFNGGGEETAQIDESIVFQINYGNDAQPRIVTFNIIDPGVMEMIFSKSITEGMRGPEKDKWYKFVDEMRDFATTRMMAWKVHDITKSRFDKNEFNKVRANSTYNQSDVQLESNMYGTRRSSYTEQANTRLIVRHSKPIDEETHGARSRNIKAIYIENADRERFLVPRNHMPTARALARHVANEGSITDDIGNAIVEMHDEMKALGNFTRKLRSTDHMMEGADDILEAAKCRYGKVRKTIESLQKQRGYQEFAEAFAGSEQLEEDGDYSDLRTTLTRQVYNEEFDDVLPYLSRAIKEAELSRVEQGPSFVADWLSSGEPLKLYAHDSEEEIALRKVSEPLMKMASVLENIATYAGRFLPDQIPIFASEVANTIENRSSDYGTHYDKDDTGFNEKLKIAVNLVKRYLDDVIKMRKNPELRDELRVERGAGSGKKVGESDVQAFESWAKTLTTEALNDQFIEAADNLSEYAYELGNTHMDFEAFVTAAQLVEARELDELKEYVMSQDTDVKEKIIDLLREGGPEVDKVVQEWLQEIGADSFGGDDDDDDNDPDMEESLEEDGDDTYGPEAREMTQTYPRIWAQLENWRDAGYGPAEMEQAAEEEFGHEAYDVVAVFVDEYRMSDEEPDWDQEIDDIRHLSGYH